MPFGSYGQRVVMILQARMGSTRLPGKSMMPLAGRPMVERILERVRRCTTVDEIVLATTVEPEDDILAELGKRLGVRVFRGSRDDVLDRYLRAAAEHRADQVVRIPADNFAPEPTEIDRVVAYHMAAGNDFSSTYPNVFDNGYPDGIGAEVISVAALQRAAALDLGPSYREHPHLNFYDHPERWRMGTIECPAAFRRPDLVLDINTPDQYRYAAQLYNDLYSRKPDFTIVDIIDWHDNVYAAEADLHATAPPSA